MIEDILKLNPGQLQNVINFLQYFIKEQNPNSESKNQENISFTPVSLDSLTEEHKVITTFPQLIKHVTQLMSDRKITATHITEICDTFGLKNMADMSNHPDLIPKFLLVIQQKMVP